MGNNSLAYLNGEYLKLEKAKISVLDRGFIFGDGLYEVVAFVGGRLFKLKEHLERYRNAAKEILLDGPDIEELGAIARELLKKSEIKNGIIYLQVTRGVAPRTHEFPESAEPTVFMFTKEVSGPDSDKINNGIKTIMFPDERWNWCNVKSISLMLNCLNKEKVKRAGAYEAIQVHRVGVTEGITSNVFGVKDGVVYTAPNGKRILPGITRGTILELANKNGIKVVENFLSVGELLCCDEVFISSTMNKILPVKQIDQATFPVANYRITFYLQQLLENHILETRE